MHSCCDYLRRVYTVYFAKNHFQPHPIAFGHKGLWGRARWVLSLSNHQEVSFKTIQTSCLENWVRGIFLSCVNIVYFWSNSVCYLAYGVLLWSVFSASPSEKEVEVSLNTFTLPFLFLPRTLHLSAGLSSEVNLFFIVELVHFVTKNNYKGTRSLWCKVWRETLTCNGSEASQPLLGDK